MMDLDEARDVAEQAADWIAQDLGEAVAALGRDESGGKRSDFVDAIRALVLAVDSYEDAATPAFDEIAKLCGCPTWEYPGQVVRDVQQVVAERDARLRDYSNTYAALSLAGIAIADGERHLDPEERIQILVRERDEARKDGERHLDPEERIQILVRERDEARKNYQFMVERAADAKLDGYREIGELAARAKAERDEAVAAARHLNDEAGTALVQQAIEIEAIERERDGWEREAGLANARAAEAEAALAEARKRGGLDRCEHGARNPASCDFCVPVYDP